MSEARKIVIVGCGPAAVGAAMAARNQDKTAEVLMLSDEDCEPYEKPPLSKAVLTGKAMPHDAPIAGPAGVGGKGITLKFNARVKEIDRGTKAVTTETGERIAYDALILATGSINRELPMFPAGQKGIHYLRTLTEAVALKADLSRSKSLLVIGGGVVGLEIASSAAELGIKTTVMEIAPRILSRVCDEETSALIHERHRRAGVDIRLATGSTALRPLPGGGFEIDTNTGIAINVDLIAVGVGIVPEDRLAHATGLTVQDGILVDDHCRTSDPSIFAAGDCTRFRGPHGPIRLENWRHAQQQGSVAGRNAAGGDQTYAMLPSYWSEQYDMYIQGMGWPIANPSQRVRRKLGDNATLLFELDGAAIAYVLGINAQREMGPARRLIEQRVPVDAAELADPSKPLNAMLKAKA
jgi:3-phenylpropionate/trans-cinnamate dioxygenase ferredoxin reductase component